MMAPAAKPPMNRGGDTATRASAGCGGNSRDGKRAGDGKSGECLGDS